MSADGGEYVSRSRVAVRERLLSAENLRRNKRQIAADVVRSAVSAKVIPAADLRAIDRLLTYLESA